MKSSLCVLVVCASAAAQTGEQASKALAARGEWDELRWSDPSKGPALRVGIVRAVPEGVEVQRGVAKRVLPYDQIGGVKFGLSMGERQLIAEASTDSIPALRVFWEARRRTIQLAGSNAGDFGLALARALQRAEVYDEAQAIVEEIAGQDHDERRRAKAKAEGETLGFVRVMKSGNPEELEKRAWAVTEAADESNPDLMLLVTGYLVTSELAKLKQIESENPRWIEDEEVRPLRERHYHRALDLALYPSLFHPLREREAAAGLWQASQIYGYAGEVASEVKALEDLVALYGASALAEQARERLRVLKVNLDGEQVSGNSDPGSQAEKPEQKADPPPPPKRYNLFED